MENVSLIDVSSEDDLLITSSSDRVQDQRPSENCDEGNCTKLESANAFEGDNPMKMSRQLEQFPELSKSPEQKRSKPGKVNLRKSLAWDNAFFTSEGVLNTEELAIVNSTFRKTEACSLPGIQEELRRSTESTSTLDSECYTVENIEEDLFENVRASIQKTISKNNSSVTRAQDGLHHGSRKKVELPFQTKAAKGSGDAKLSLKPPRVVPKPTSLTVGSSKDSSGSLQNKNTIRRTSSGGANQQVAPALPKTTGDSSIMATRSLKPSPGSRALVYSTVSSSSSSSPVNNSSSELAGKSPLESTRKRSALRNTTKTPTATSKSRLGLSNTQRLPRCASSTLKLPSGMSPSSSIDSFSSEASSSTSASIKPSKSVESFASSTSSTPSLAFSTDVDGYQPADSTDQPFVNKGASANLLLSRHLAKAPTNTHISGSKSLKPSGLRMPSPKIGYFDAEKTLVSNPSKFSQSNSRSSLLKSTAATKDPIKAEKSKSSKIPSIRTTEQHVSMNFVSSKSLSIPKSPSMRPASPMLMHRLPNSAHLHKHLSLNSSEECRKIEGNESKDSGQLSLGVADNRAQTTYQICKEEKPKTYGLNSQDGIENDSRSGSKKIQKENLLPVYETGGVIHYSPSSGQKVSVVEIMDKKMASLSLSETSNFVNGD